MFYNLFVIVKYNEQVGEEIMASVTSVKSGSWSSSDTWDVGVPGNGDTVIIASDHTVIFDVDQSSFASGLAGLTVNGTLKWATDVVTYLKMATDAVIGGIGTLQIGSSNNRIQRPPQGSQERATIKLQGSNSKITTPNIYVYGWDERPARTTLAASASSGSTTLVLSDDMNLQPGDKILVGAGTVNDYLKESAKGIYTVSAYNSDTKTVTLSTGLGHSREAGDYLIPFNRTVYFDFARNPSLEPYTPGFHRFEGVRVRYSLGWTATLNKALADGVLADKCTFMSTGMYGGHYGPYIVQNSTFYDSSVYWSQNTTFKDCTFIHRESADGGFVSYSAGAVFDSCWFQNARAVIYRYPDLGWGFSQHRSCKARNLQSGAYGSFSHRITCYNMDFGGYTPVNKLHYHHRLYDCLAPTISIGYGGTTLEGALESFNHNQVPGAYMAWYWGGTVQSQSNVTPPGKTRAYQYTLTNSVSPVRRTIHLGTIEPGKKVMVDVWLRKSTTMEYAPRAYLFNATQDPYFAGDDGKLAEAILPGESVNEWKNFRLKWKNDTGKVVPVAVRCEAKNSTGFVYEVIDTGIRRRGGGVVII